jgi:hypothetical protein
MTRHIFCLTWNWPWWSHILQWNNMNQIWIAEVWRCLNYVVLWCMPPTKTISYCTTCWFSLYVSTSPFCLPKTFSCPFQGACFPHISPCAWQLVLSALYMSVCFSSMRGWHFLFIFAGTVFKQCVSTRKQKFPCWYIYLYSLNDSYCTAKTDNPVQTSYRLPL